MRQLSIGRLIALVTGATIVLLLSLDTALACRFLARRHAYFACPPVLACPPVTICPPACVTVEEVVVHHEVCPPVCGIPICDSNCAAPCGQCAGEVIVDSGYPVESTPTPTVIAPSEPAPVPDVESQTEVDEVPDRRDVEPAIVEEPVETEEPAVEEPADDLFDEPAVEPLQDDAASAPEEPSDLFAEPAEEAPADAPAEEMPADDLFGEPAADELPSDDDLFGAPEAPADEPVPADDGFDLPDADQPADEGGTDDSLDDLFGATESSLDSATEDVAAPETELFDEPAAAPVDETPQDDGAADDLDDLFGQVQPPSTVTRPTARADLPFRQWTDNTGHYHTQARLVTVTDTHVRLLKDNGRFTTVSKQRLSQADLVYVDQMTREYGPDQFEQVARR